MVANTEAKPVENETFVVIYDEGETESYYGYFDSPEEAKTVFGMYAHGLELTNVRLCRVVEEWPDTAKG